MSAQFSTARKAGLNIAVITPCTDVTQIYRVPLRVAAHSSQTAATWS